MTLQILLAGPLVLSAFFCIGTAIAFRRTEDLDRFGDEKRKWLYTGRDTIIWLTMIIAGMLILPRSGERMMGLCVELFVFSGAVFMILLCCMPLLRKFFSARVCGVLWTLPAYIIVAQLLSDRFSFSAAWILRIPVFWSDWIGVLWAVGAAGVMGWSVISHLLFRRRILKAAVPVEGTWLVRSPEVKTPLSIGFFERTRRIVLPDRQYTGEEMELILHHEQLHIERQDCFSKLLMTLCAAVWWFNPLVWIAMRRCAEDLELSCDETVLRFAGDKTRREYANLLLRTAGEERGFTTCLAASVSALRYRLENIIKPRQRFFGTVLLSLSVGILVLSVSLVGLAYNPRPAGEILPGHMGEGFCQVELSGVQSTEMTSELMEYIADLQISSLTGSYRIPSDAQRLQVTGRGIESDSKYELILTDRFLSLKTGNGRANIYYLHEDTDWDLLKSLLTQ